MLGHLVDGPTLLGPVVELAEGLPVGDPGRYDVGERRRARREGGGPGQHRPGPTCDGAGELQRAQRLVFDAYIPRSGPASPLRDPHHAVDVLQLVRRAESGTRTAHSRLDRNSRTDASATVAGIRRRSPDTAVSMSRRCAEGPPSGGRWKSKARSHFPPGEPGMYAQDGAGGSAFAGPGASVVGSPAILACGRRDVG